MPEVDTDRLRSLAAHSLAVIRGNQAPSGAYLASPTFPVYRYSWFRDGAFIADAMSRAGEAGSADAFFDWCRRIVEDRAGQIHALAARHRAGDRIPARDFLHTRYTVDGTDSPEEWWTFQLDGYGTWLWALDAHARRHGTDLAPYADAMALTVEYLAEFWSEPCYDWWEEHVTERHTSTLAAIHAGLHAAAGRIEIPAPLAVSAAEASEAIAAAVRSQGVRDGRLTKWLGGTELDGSLIACATPFRLVDPAGTTARATVAALEAELAHGGVHRYADDVYYGGGEWLLLAGFLGWHYANVGRLDDARSQLEWIAAHATVDGDLPEQVSDHLLHPETLPEWTARWGPVATPLLWSHAMYLTLALELGIVPLEVASR